MLDIKLIRENPEKVKKAIESKNEKGDVDKLLKLDKQRRDLIYITEDLKKQRNENSSQVALAKKEGRDAQALIVKTKEISQQIKEHDEKLQQIENEIYTELSRLPNLPHGDVPIGKDAADNVEVKRWGSIPEFDFKALDHLQLGERLNILDFKRGGKVTGSGFPVYKGLGARLERALINYMLDIHINEHGYTEIFPPFLANRESMFGTGQLPKLENDMYLADKDDLFLIPTSEVTVTNLHRDEILPGDKLPIKYTAYSACFRREAGSYGKETRGFLRVHQFNKVEMVNFVRPEESYQFHEQLLKEATDILERLNIPYRVLLLCTGDLSFAAAKCYDIETWSPAEQKWLEASSVSNFEDFQARRANIRFKDEQGAKPAFVHTLNGSGLATSRLMVSLLENYQTDEGTVIIPEPLRPYMGNMDIIKRSY
ncbi:MAG: serine--tRNA ligase [Calditrichaceae bacterium]|nr:serine--tRNA ligase [Calditrichaceae bacterium]MBN2708050.1 serine--tRNA ligase [Calditrichaceae bacterium]RQV97768.1 MAG: serine--tRNA ligase [Calditrichota bacterium]